MAVNRDPILKRCRALDLSPAVLGYDKKSNRNPNGNKRKKESEYASQLKEKQKLKFIYGVLEKQFYHYYELATKEEGIAGAAAAEQVQQMAAAMQGHVAQMQAAMQEALAKGDMAEYMRLAQEFQQKMMEQALGQQK